MDFNFSDIHLFLKYEGNKLSSKYVMFEWYHLSLVTRKPVFGVSDQVRVKLACSATETS